MEWRTRLRISGQSLLTRGADYAGWKLADDWLTAVFAEGFIPWQNADALFADLLIFLAVTTENANYWDQVFDDREHRRSIAAPGLTIHAANQGNASRN